MKEYYIYMHRNKINNKIYIGQTCQKPEKRWNYGHGYKNCPRFYSAIIAYGWNSFEHIILEQGIMTQEEADEKEKYYIKKYNTLDNNFGYNLVEGGHSLSEYWSSELHKQQQSERKKQYYKDNIDKKIENDQHLLEISRSSASLRSEKMKDNYKNKGGLFQINQQRKRIIQCVETKEIFPSLTEASKKYHISIGNISSVINGKRKTAGGYHWKALEV